MLARLERNRAELRQDLRGFLIPDGGDIAHDVDLRVLGNSKLLVHTYPIPPLELEPERLDNCVPLQPRALHERLRG